MLVDHRGKPLSSSQFKKAPPPKTGEQYGNWAGDNVGLMNLPGAGAITFDLDRLTSADFRQMMDNYQINSSLSILTFMMHQAEWHIEVDGPKKIADRCEEQIRRVWSRLVRAMSQAFPLGYSPNVLQWENDTGGGQIVLDKIKDLIPEDCRVNWDTVEGTADTPGGTRPKFKVYGGIAQAGATRKIPVDNSFWYPLLMSNGDYYGKKLLRSAFQPWFFSILLHLFANRYYERYGEPTPVGRAPYEDEIDFNGKSIKGNKMMDILITQLRNRSAVVLPNERTQVGQEQEPKYDYTLEYLESQMRGADFERYMTRLDEEMSLALFTPILMMRTAEVGSYNLGVGHTQVYLWMLNAITGDWAHYINKYILWPITKWNFGLNAPKPEIKFAKMGKVSTEMLRTVVSEMMKNGQAKPRLQELSEMVGMTFEEFETTTEPLADPADRTGEPDDTDATPSEGPGGTAKKVAARLAPQVKKAYSQGRMGPNFKPNFGFQKYLETALKLDGHPEPDRATAQYFSALEQYTSNLAACHSDIPDPAMFMRLFHRFAQSEVDKIAA